MAKERRESDGKVFRVLPRQVDQTIAAALREWLPGKSWSEVRRLLKARQVTVNGNSVRRRRLPAAAEDVVKLLPHSAAAAGRAKTTCASGIWTSTSWWWRSRPA